MPKTPVEAWESTINEIKGALEEEAFDLWVKPTKFVDFNNGQLNLEVPNRFFQDWLTEHLSHQMIDLFTKHVGHDSRVSLQFAVSPASLDRANQIKKEEIEPLPPVNTETNFYDVHFNPKYTFDTFVIGPSNRFAQAASQAVAKEPGRAYNPLFIYGGVGLGKTHLLHGIGHYIKTNYPQMRLLYITSERFVNEFIDSIRYSKPGEFRAKYRNVDVLLVDDVQFFGGKGSSQEGFFHTFNALWETHKQLVFSSDRPPKEIPNLEERLTSRFEWGLVTDIQPPDLETRIAILRRKAEVEKMSVPEDVLLFIANKIKSNIRELEGALIRVVAFSSMTGQRISLDLAEDILKALLPARESEAEISIDLIQEVVAKEFNLDKKDMKSKRRTEAIAYPRQIAMYLARSMTEYSLPEIGDAFGGRDHTTVMYAYDKISKKINSDPFFSALINKIISKLKNKS